jgi:hypothetical protein
MLLAFVSAAAPVSAQSTSVGASFVGNIFRSSSATTDIGLGREISADGESIGVALAVSRALGDRWGVEAEFVLPTEIERDEVQDVGILAIPGLTQALGIDIHTRQRHTTLAATMWFRQPVGGRASLVYLGGVSFARVRREAEISFGALRPPTGLIVPTGTTTVTYSTAPVVGLEARIALTAHVFLVTGIRLHGVGDAAGSGWLLRPGVGVAWGF